MRTNVYGDGCNPYYGWSEGLCVPMARSRRSVRAHDPVHQKMYLRTLATLPNVSIQEATHPLADAFRDDTTRLS